MDIERPLLHVHGLTIGFPGTDKPAVNGVSFELRRGETLGIVGESGSGKSLTSLALMGLIPKVAGIAAGSASLHADGRHTDLLHGDAEALRRLRGPYMAMVFQEPMTSLNPVMTCGEQVAEMLRHHLKISRREAQQRCIALFNEVELPLAESIFHSYPHQLSGGQKQRVMIAMAISCEPHLLIADEPTTALDVTMQKHILELLNRLRDKNRMGMIFISHDLGVVSQVAHQVLVLYKGDVVEHGPAHKLFTSPEHPYTRALIACRPPLHTRPHRLVTVQSVLEKGQSSEQASERKETPQGSPLLEATGVQVWYASARNWRGKPTAWVQAVNDVSLTIHRGETVGLVGESGCGKSTLGRALLRLVPLHSGRIVYCGTELSTFGESQMRPYRKKLQLIFQDPYASLNPRFTIGQTLREPLVVHGLAKGRAEAETKVKHVLDRVGLTANALAKYPHEFSGGQRQRICIARALMVEPELIVCDESVSALDVSVQAQVLNLLNELKEDLGLTYLFISHDLSVVKYMSDRMLVMRRGRVEEEGPTDAVYARPQSPYTRDLIGAIPTFESQAGT